MVARAVQRCPSSWSKRSATGDVFGLSVTAGFGGGGRMRPSQSLRAARNATLSDTTKPRFASAEASKASFRRSWS